MDERDTCRAEAARILCRAREARAPTRHTQNTLQNSNEVMNSPDGKDYVADTQQTSEAVMDYVGQIAADCPQRGHKLRCIGKVYYANR